MRRKEEDREPASKASDPPTGASRTANYSLMKPPSTNKSESQKRATEQHPAPSSQYTGP